VSVRALREQGYEPEAVVRFAAGLNWTPPDDAASLDDMARSFSLNDLREGREEEGSVAQLDAIQEKLFRRRCASGCPQLTRTIQAEVAAAAPAALAALPSWHSEDRAVMAADASARSASIDYCRLALEAVAEVASRRSDVTGKHIYLWVDPVPPLKKAPASLDDKAASQMRSSFCLFELLMAGEDDKMVMDAINRVATKAQVGGTQCSLLSQAVAFSILACG